MGLPTTLHLVAPAPRVDRETYLRLAQRAKLIVLLGNALAGAWWLDPVVGLLIAGLAVREGLEAWRGEGCCVSDPQAGAAPANDACEERSCATDECRP